jgi:hypothetical protein
MYEIDERSIHVFSLKVCKENISMEALVALKRIMLIFLAMRPEMFLTVKIRIMTFWVTAPCTLIDGYQCFRESCRLLLQVKNLFLVFWVMAPSFFIDDHCCLHLQGRNIIIGFWVMT